MRVFGTSVRLFTRRTNDSAEYHSKDPQRSIGSFGMSTIDAIINSKRSQQQKQ
jgi:hypothetical protein